MANAVRVRQALDATKPRRVAERLVLAIGVRKALHADASRGVTESGRQTGAIACSGAGPNAREERRIAHGRRRGAVGRGQAPHARARHQIAMQPIGAALRFLGARAWRAVGDRRVGVPAGVGRVCCVENGASGLEKCARGRGPIEIDDGIGAATPEQHDAGRQSDEQGQNATASRRRPRARSTHSPHSTMQSGRATLTHDTAGRADPALLVSGIDG
jgi:hypothetical protein